MSSVSYRWTISRALGFTLAFLVFVVGHVQAAPSFPALTGRVVDDAGILSGDTQQKLTAMLAQHETATGQQVVVATVKSLQGYSIEDYGYQLGRSWGIGQKDKNTGVILLIAPQEHDVRIEVGYGLEGLLTDAQSKLIIENAILPAFRSGDFNAGALNGTTLILRALGGNPASANTTPIVQVGPAESGLTVFGNILALFVLFLVFGWWFSTLFLAPIGRQNSGSYYGGGYIGRGGFGGGGFGGGGFSGGGGSFGGGGASGHW